MGFITDTAEQRKRVWHDPQPYEYQPGSQIIAPNAPVPAGMVTSQPPAQPAQAPVVAPAQLAVQPQAPAPIAPPAQTSAPQQAPGVVTPMFAPTQTPAQYQNLKQNYEQNDMQAPPPAQPTAIQPATPQAPSQRPRTGYDIQLEQATQQRKQATNARFKAAGKPVPYPEAEAPAPAPLPQDVYGDTTGDSELDDEIRKNEALKGLQKQHESDVKRGKVTPELAQRHEKRQKEADRLRDVVIKTYRANKRAKADEQAKKDDKAEEQLKMSRESAARTEKRLTMAETSVAKSDAEKDRNKEAARLAGEAQAALGTGDHANAKKMALEGLKLFADTPSQAKFDTVVKGVRAAETIKAAASFDAEKVTPATRAVSQAEKDVARNIAYHKSATITYYRLQGMAETGDEAKDEAHKNALAGAWTRVQEAQKKVDDAQAARDAAKNTLEDLVKQRESIKSGEIAPAGQAPAPGGAAPTGQAPATQPAPAKPASQAGTQVPANFGNRVDGTPKGNGFFGPLPMMDGSGKVATELSLGVNFDGKETLIPALVPTLDWHEVGFLRTGGDLRESGSIPTSIRQKAIAHAKQRLAAGKSPFIEDGEQSSSVPPAQPASQAEYNALPPGTRYVHRDGSIREKK